MASKNEFTSLVVFRLILELVQTDDLSDLGRRVAIGTLVSHTIADITGVPVEGAADIAWAVRRAQELGY